MVMNGKKMMTIGICLVILLFALSIVGAKAAPVLDDESPWRDRYPPPNPAMAWAYEQWMNNQGSLFADAVGGGITRILALFI
ncbi:MAG: hypothetical protein QW797_03215 [Thermoproteota archaeon]